VQIGAKGVPEVNRLVFNGFSLGGLWAGTFLIQLFGNNVSAWQYRSLPISSVQADLGEIEVTTARLEKAGAVACS
jgi:hypothetical protein